MHALIGSTAMGGQGGPAAGITVVALDGPNTRVVGSTATATSSPMYLATWRCECFFFGPLLVGVSAAIAPR